MMKVVTIRKGIKRGFVIVMSPVDGFYAENFDGGSVVQFGTGMKDHMDVKDAWERFRRQISHAELQEFKNHLLNAAGLDKDILSE